MCWNEIMKSNVNEIMNNDVMAINMWNNEVINGNRRENLIVMTSNEILILFNENVLNIINIKLLMVYG